MKSHRARSSGRTASVCGVVVTHHPDLERLRTVLKAVSAQADHVLVVDNTPAGCKDLDRCYPDPQITIWPLRSNRGVAAGHNAGIRWARENEHTHVLLLDQDSLPASDMLERLLAAEGKLKGDYARVAAVAPQFFDPRYGQPAPFIVRRGWRVIKLACASRGGQDHHRVEYAISSGTLIALGVLDEIGEMDAGLFIDYVDIEWGLRAQSKGYYCFGVCDAHMQHELGDKVMAVPRVGCVPVRSPLRHYYHFRNAIHLYKRPYAPFPWVVNDACRLALKYVFYSTVTSPRRQHLKMMTLGVWHGLRGRFGPYPATFPD